MADDKILIVNEDTVDLPVDATTGVNILPDS